MTAQEKLTAILTAIQSGRTIYVSTMTRATKIRKADVAKFDKIGRPLFRVQGNSLYMSVGKRYDCIDYCQVTTE